MLLAGMMKEEENGAKINWEKVIIFMEEVILLKQKNVWLKKENNIGNKRKPQYEKT